MNTAALLRIILKSLALVVALIGALGQYSSVLQPLFKALNLDLTTIIGVAVGISAVASILGDLIDNGKLDGSFMRVIPFVAALGALGAAGCAISAQRQAQIGATLSYAGQKAANVALNTVLQYAVSQSDATKKTDISAGLATAFRSQEGNLIDSSDIKALYGIWTPPKPHWEQAINVLAAGLEEVKRDPKSQAAYLEAAARVLEVAKAPAVVYAVPSPLGSPEDPDEAPSEPAAPFGEASQYVVTR